MFNLPEILHEVIESGLLVDEILHGVVAVPFAIFLWYKCKSWRSILVFYLVVYLIDFDHLIDYWFYFGLKLDVLEFLRLDFFAEKATAILIFHGWEWPALYFILFFKKRGWKSYLTAVAWGMFAHLVWDIHNLWSVEFYSIIYRAMHGFRF
jgi:hypothetical protein